MLVPESSLLKFLERVAWFNLDFSKITVETMKDKLRKERLKAEPSWKIIATAGRKIDESLKMQQEKKEQVRFRISMTKDGRVKLKLNPQVFSLSTMEASKISNNFQWL